MRSFNFCLMKHNNRPMVINVYLKATFLTLLMIALFMGNSFAQTGTVTGMVKDRDNLPVEGATISVEETNTSAVADKDGKFTIKAEKGNTLVITSVNFQTQRVVVNENENISLVLEPKPGNLNDVVVIGYGSQRRKLSTGATVRVRGEDLTKLSTVSPINALQGQSPGVSITQNSGKPGSGYKINIRGLGTIGNASPLIIIDNIVGGDLNMLNPGDIESIDILKDAASAAIYGARAANGVIMVRTKQGKKGKTSVSYDGFYGVQNVANSVDVLNAQEYIEAQNEAFRNNGSPIPNWAAVVPEYNRIQQGWEGPNWQNEFKNKNAPIQSHTLNITGGSENSNFSMGMSYTSQEAIFGQPVAPIYNRYSFRINSEHVIYRNSSFDVIKIGQNLLYNYIDQQNNGLATGDVVSNDVRNTIQTHPLMDVYDANGNYTKAIPWTERVNPIGLYDYERTGNRSQTHDFRITPYLEIQPIKRLIFKSNFGFKYNAGTFRSYVPAYDLGGRSVTNLDRVNQGMGSGYGYVWENTLNYKFRVKDDHSFDALIGQSVDRSGFGESVSGGNRGSIFTGFEYAYLNNVKTLNPANISINGAPYAETFINSYFGRLNYDFKEKYLFSVIMRADGSSNFAPDKRWGYFPSVAAGWNVTNESFMESTRKVIDFLKIRASWGQNGNQAISPFQYLSRWSLSGQDYYFGPEKNSTDVGGFPSVLPNPDVTWETAEQLNIGFDAKFLGARLGLTVDWYNKKTLDWLVQAPVPGVWGAPPPFINGGDISNKGLELVLSWNDQKGDFTYGISGNVSFNKNEVLSIDNPEGIINGATTIFSTADRSAFYRAQVGFPIGYFYGYKTAGVFQSQADIDKYTGAKLPNVKPGDLIYVDIDNNKVIDSRDKTMIGDPNPNAIFGMNLNFGYKGFDFSLSANGVAGNQIAANLRPAENIQTNWPKQYMGRWHGEGTSNRYPRFSSGASPNWGLNSDIYIESGDFLRIQNLTLGYDFKRILTKLPFSQARIYFAANNLYTFTDYFGSDPEIGFANQGWSKGIDLGFFGAPRTFMMGINLKY